MSFFLSSIPITVESKRLSAAISLLCASATFHKLTVLGNVLSENVLRYSLMRVKPLHPIIPTISTIKPTDKNPLTNRVCKLEFFNIHTLVFISKLPEFDYFTICVTFAIFAVKYSLWLYLLFLL